MWAKRLSGLAMAAPIQFAFAMDKKTLFFGLYLCGQMAKSIPAKSIKTEISIPRCVVYIREENFSKFSIIIFSILSI